MDVAVLPFVLDHQKTPLLEIVFRVEQALYGREKLTRVPLVTRQKRPRVDLYERYPEMHMKGIHRIKN